jgi:Ca2+-binding RTX toxin-like protein
MPWTEDWEDFASFFFSSAGVTVSLTTGTATGEGTDTLAGIEDLEGSRQNDSLMGDAGPNVFWAAVGNDTIDGSTGTDTVCTSSPRPRSRRT